MAYYKSKIVFLFLPYSKTLLGILLMGFLKYSVLILAPNKFLNLYIYYSTYKIFCKGIPA